MTTSPALAKLSSLFDSLESDVQAAVVSHPEVEAAAKQLAIVMLRVAGAAVAAGASGLGPVAPVAQALVGQAEQAAEKAITGGTPGNAYPPAP